MCHREGVYLKQANDIFRYKVEVDEGVFVNFQSPKGFSKFIKKRYTDNFLTTWESKHSQGRVRREVKDVNWKATQAIFNNQKSHDKLFEFTIKARLQLLNCNSLLHIYFPHIHNKRCNTCNNPHETVSHILNGCTVLRDAYTNRHNRILDLIHQKVQTYNKDTIFIKIPLFVPHLLYQAIIVTLILGNVGRTWYL